jgi:methyl-accepting chemotaxis protein
LAGALMIRRSIARPLAEVTRVIEAVAAGDAAVAVPFRDCRDEVGAMARSIAVFRDAIRRNVELHNTALAEASAKVQRQDQIAAKTARFGTEIEASPSSTGCSSICCRRRRG